MFRTVIKAVKYLHLLKPLWDSWLWSVCSDLYCKLRFFFGHTQAVSAGLLSVVGFVCSQIVAPVLNYGKQQPGGALNFHKTITASWIQELIQSSIRWRERDGLKREWWISRAQTNRRCDRVMERLCCAFCWGGISSCYNLNVFFLSLHLICIL